MEEHIVKLLDSEYVTHDVKRFVVQKPQGYTFKPGQATEVSINKPEWKDEKRPFTFTSLNEWKELEFTIKIYREHNGVTAQLEKLQKGDELIIREVWGTINYQGNGTFIAGGAGITPFIAILRDLKRKRQIRGDALIYSNKTSSDIIYKEELQHILGPDLHLVLTRERVIGFMDKRIDEDLLMGLVKDFNQHFYVCGPEQFVKDIQAVLLNLGAKSEAVVIEK
jgi:ferredoxin-NADP reductase